MADQPQQAQASTGNGQPLPNPIGLDGIEFVEFSSPEPEALHKIFTCFGFSRLKEHQDQDLDLYQQGDINFVVNRRAGSFSESFYQAHGPCVPAMGWRVNDAERAHQHAVERGAKDMTEAGDYRFEDGTPVPAIEGIGGSLIYFVNTSARESFYRECGFTDAASPDRIPSKGFEVIDHLTNNVFKGTMAEVAEFYKSVFGFVEIRYFDIRGVKTGLTSFALKSPCGKFSIPINEGTEKKSQINEYLDEYKGPGVQHIAFLTRDILHSLKELEGSPIQTLDIDDQYYQEVFDRVPNVTEDHETIQRYKVLIDGDDDGYLLQIFTKNLIGPIFIELIQRKNHYSFGEGNFGALFRAIERDQEKRGYLEV